MNATQSPRLDVPQASRDRRGSGTGGLMFVLLLILLVINIMRFFVATGPSEVALGPPAASTLSVQQLKEVAVELEAKNIAGLAADRWEEYLELAQPERVEAGRIRYRIGKNRQANGEYERAYDQFIRAEKLIGADEQDLLDEIGRRRRECLRRRGLYSELAREIARQASPDGGGDDVAAQQVVAQIESEKITVADFDRMLAGEIDLAVRSRLGLSPAEEDATRQQAARKFQDPRMRAAELQRMIVTRVLAEEARRLDLHQSEAYLDRLAAAADGILGSTLLFDEVAKRATVTDEDVARFHAAHVDRYAEPAASFIAHILCRDEAHARALIRQLNDGAAFGELAKRESLDQQTAGKLGVVTTPVPDKEQVVPMFGRQPVLHTAIREAEASAVLPEPYQSDQGWHVIKVLSHRNRIEPALDEVRDQVRRDTQSARQREVTDQYLGELFERYQVRIYPEVFGGTDAPVNPLESAP